MGNSTFYAASYSRVIRQLDLWKEHLPMIQPYYAIKCNPEDWLISWLTKKGIGFDCASIREINIIKRIDKEAPIIYANPCKKRSDILQGAVSRVNTTVIDSYEELDKFSELGWSGNSLLRICVEDSGSLMPFSAKFGADLKDVKHLAKYAHIKGQNLSGISFHVGSGCRDAQQYKKAIDASHKSIKILREMGHSASIIDIGGGFTNDDFIESSKVIKETNISENITMIAEPGRFFAATSQDLFVQVIGKKISKDKKGWRYTLDESLYGQFSCIPFDHAKPKWIRVRKEGEEVRSFTQAVLYGRTCDSVDFIAAGRCEELMEGDWLWFPHMGAYTTVTSTEFNGFPKPPTQILEGYNELPEPGEFNSWPENLKYASAVQVPLA